MPDKIWCGWSSVLNLGTADFAVSAFFVGAILFEVFITKHNYKGSSSSCGCVGRHSVICGTNARGREPHTICVIWLPWLPCQKGGNDMKLVRHFRVSMMLIRQKKRKERKKENIVIVHKSQNTSPSRVWSLSVCDLSATRVRVIAQNSKILSYDVMKASVTCLLTVAERI